MTTDTTGTLDQQIVGKICTIEHTRKGKFTMQVTAATDERIDGIVTDGRAHAMLAENEAVEDDPITIRRDFIRSIQVID